MTLEEIYRENYPIVYGYLLSLCEDPLEAEELAAETFLRGIQNAKRYDGSCKPSTWLCTIGKNLYFNERKRKKRFVPLDESLHKSADSPEEQYIKKDTANRLLQAAKQLEPPYRQVFFLRMEGLSFREIGDAMERTENWARVTFFRAKTKLLDETEVHYG